MAIRKECFHGQSKFSDFRVHAYRDSRTGGCHVTAMTVNGELLIPTRTFWVQLARLFGRDATEIPFGGEYELMHALAHTHGDVRLVYRVTRDGCGNQLLSGVKRPTTCGRIGDSDERLFGLTEYRCGICDDDRRQREWPLLRASTLDELLDGLDEIPLSRRFTLDTQPSPGFAPSPAGCLRPSLN